MDSKRLMIGMLAALAVLLGWNFVVVQLAQKYNWDLGQQPSAPVVQQVPQPTAYPQPAPPAPTATTQVEAPGSTAPTSLKLRVLPAAPSASVLLGSTEFKNQTWSMGLQTSAAGASIASVTLTEFPRSDSQRKEPYIFQQPSTSGLSSMATLWARIDGQNLDLSRAAWELVNRSADTSSVTYAVNIGREQPALRILKTYTIKPRKTDGKDTLDGGYEVQLRHRIENLSGQPAEVQLGIAGPTTPPREMEHGPDLFVFAGYNKNPGFPDAPMIEPKAWGVESLKGESQTVDLTRGDKDRPVIWAGIASTYFDAMVLPVGAKPIDTAQFLDSIKAHALPGPTGAPIGAEIVFQTKPLRVLPGAPTEFDLMAFFGPKARNVIKNAYYGVYPREYFATLSTGGSCFCTFQWLVDIMVNLLRTFQFVLRDWGLAIIALVILVRGIMHPLTRKSTMSMHRMSKLAPEMERIKKKYADDPKEQQRATMAFYKEHGAGQLLGCLPMFLQMPIWIALWSSLQSTFELRLAPFLWGFTWIDDLAKPDRLIPLPNIDLYFFVINGINILPILMGVFFFLQQKYTPKPVSTTPEQAQQQKMMQWMMVLMFPLMLYNGPSGLNLYIFTSTAIGMMESKWIRDHIKAREAAEAAAGPVIIDVPSRGSSEPIKPKGRLGQFIERMQKMAEDAQSNQQQKRPKK